MTTDINSSQNSNRIPPSKIIVLIIAVVSIIAIPLSAIKFFTVAHQESSDVKMAKEESDKLEKSKTTELEFAKKISDENTKLGFQTVLKDGKPDDNYGSKIGRWQVNWATNFGDIKVNLDSKDAPKTVENFVRLSDRGVYNNTIIHRIVKSNNFAVIQGGDFDKQNGKGGQSAFYIDENKPNNVPDELWTTTPTLDNETGIATGGVFRNASLYSNFDEKQGRVEYAKGLILMAKTQAPDSASSQFFVTLDKTILPAQYTVLGSIDPSTISTLDKIQAEVNPVKQSVNSATGNPETAPATNGDGAPDKLIKIVQTTALPL